MSDSDTPPSVPKKRPGRPKKQVPAPLLPKEGIVERPSNTHYEDSDPNMVNVLEILYDNPLTWKNIFSLFRAMSSNDIQCAFDRDCVKMHGTDHNNTNEIYVKLFGDRLNRYYCAEPFEILLNVNNFCNVLSTLHKDHTSILISTDVQRRRSSLSMTLRNSVMKENSCYNVNINEGSSVDWAALEAKLAAEESYPIKFDWPIRYFKKKITDAQSFCEELRIEKNGHEDLCLKFTFQDGRGDNNSSYEDGGLINLISMLGPDDFFTVSVLRSYLQPISKALPAGDVHVAADSERELIFTYLLDPEDREGNGALKKYNVFGTEKGYIKVITNIITLNR